MSEINVYMEMSLDKHIPAAVFPKGFEFKPIARNSGYIWEKVMDEAFGNYTAGDFELVMVENYAYLPERVYILFDEDGNPCGTASAWSQPWLWGDDSGYIIFVGVIPSSRGKGLATQMVLHLCQVIKKRGQHHVLLDVDSNNLPALKSYINAGFLPHLTTIEEKDIWSRIFMQLDIEPLTYSLTIRPAKNNPHPDRPYLLDLRNQGFDVI
jgi:RimJ/RimL family protein N-acetyltransferase